MQHDPKFSTGIDITSVKIEHSASLGGHYTDHGGHGGATSPVGRALSSEGRGGTVRRIDSILGNQRLPLLSGSET